MSDNMEPLEKPTKLGILSLVQLNDTEMDQLLEYLGKVHKTTNFDLMYGIFGDKFLQFIDIFSEETVKVPSRDSVFKSVKYLRIYNYWKRRGADEEAFELTAKAFEMRKSSIKRIVEKIKKVEEQKNGDTSE